MHCHSGAAHAVKQYSYQSSRLQVDFGRCRQWGPSGSLITPPAGVVLQNGSRPNGAQERPKRGCRTRPSLSSPGGACKRLPMTRSSYKIVPVHTGIVEMQTREKGQIETKQVL